MSSNTETLLDELRLLFGALYLSDLRNAQYFLNANSRVALLAIPENRYPLEEWIEAASYILGQPCRYSSIAEIKEAILLYRMRS